MRVLRESLIVVALLLAAACGSPKKGDPTKMGNDDATEPDAQTRSDSQMDASGQTGPTGPSEYDGSSASQVDGSTGGTTDLTDAGGSSAPSKADPSPGCNHAWTPSDVTQEAAQPGYKAAMQVVRRSMVVANVMREYLVAVPQDYDASQTHALVFGFHGNGGTREQLRNYMNLEIPAHGEAVFIYPSGLSPPGGNSTWDPVDAADNPSADMAFVDKLIEQYSNELCIDRKRIFATGHSMGGCMTTGIGCFRGTVFRAIAPVAPGLPWPLGPCVGQVAVFGIHSPKDTNAHYVLGNFICTHFMRENMCDEDPKCGCYWTEELSKPEHLCEQTKQEPYVAGVPITVNEYDDKPPVLRQYENCTPGFPVVFADHWHREQLAAGDPKERYHNPPPWSAAAIWDFFKKLP